MTWLDLRVTRSKEITETYWRGQSRTDARGGYEICGVPTSTGLRIRVTSDSAASGLVDLLGNGPRVRRRDLMVGKVVGSVVAPGGTIAGLVTDSAGMPISGARVNADGVEEIRSDSAGRFLVRNVPLGSRQVEVLAIGMKPVTTVVDVIEGETATVLATMTPVTTLDVIRVTASRGARRLSVTSMSGVGVASAT